MRALPTVLPGVVVIEPAVHGDPDPGIAWAAIPPITSERDRRAPRRAAIADGLPFIWWG